MSTTAVWSESEREFQIERRTMHNVVDMIRREIDDKGSAELTPDVLPVMLVVAKKMAKDAVAEAEAAASAEAATKAEIAAEAAALAKTVEKSVVTHLEKLLITMTAKNKEQRTRSVFSIWKRAFQQNRNASGRSAILPADTNVEVLNTLIARSWSLLLYLQHAWKQYADQTRRTRINNAPPVPSPYLHLRRMFNDIRAGNRTPALIQTAGALVNKVTMPIPSSVAQLSGPKLLNFVLSLCFTILMLLVFCSIVIGDHNYLMQIVRNVQSLHEASFTLTMCCVYTRAYIK